MNNITSIQISAGGLSQVLETTFQDTLLEIRRPDLGFYLIEGMSGWRYRFFINRLIKSLESPRYLEVGSWKGSTFCSAIAGNAVNALAIDNWTQFGGPKDEFLSNVARFGNARAKTQFVEADFRSVDYSAIGQFNVYLFDGPHKEADQYDGLALAAPALSSEFVLVIDDWNHPPVPAGSRKALKRLGWKIQTSIEVRTTLDGSKPALHGKDSEWHNGYFIGVVQKD